MNLKKSNSRCRIYMNSGCPACNPASKVSRCWVMNSVWLVATILIITMPLQAQDRIHVIQPEPIPSVYLGFGGGINHYTGLIGLGAEIPVFSSFSLFANAGIGSWGTKAGGGLRYYFHPNLYGSALAFGYSQASGLKDFEIELEVDNPRRDMNVLLDLEPVGCVNIDYSYNLKMGRKSKVSFHAGFSVPLGEGDNYKVKTHGVQLSSNSKETLEFIQPGGLLLGINLMFGL